MKKILNIISSPRGAGSYSIQLAETLIGKLKTEHPGSTVKTVDLVREQFPHLEEAQLAGFLRRPTSIRNSIVRLCVTPMKRYGTFLIRISWSSGRRCTISLCHRR
ncbi:NAD(P)H-dependent oxidoreductase [Puia sp. P3]|uniref:NAD(P)H-dependent oxidoreductase n=1 Tax=Puia sp. P3 TaxID=3423952 RepID=UPI003D6715E9